MTGFGAAVGEVGGSEIRVEVRSVNHRHLQVKVRLPGDLSGLEGDIEGRARKQLKRGAVTVSVQVVRGASAGAGAINLEVAERYREALGELSQRHDGDGAVPIEAILALPGVVSARDEERTMGGHTKAVIKLVDQAFADLVVMRRREGDALEADLRMNAAAVDKLIGRIDRRMPQVVRGHQAALRRRVGDLLSDRTSVEPSDLARELAILTDKLDVSEEISRLRSHMHHLCGFLDKGGDLGRKLDFLVQEIFREANTIGSKCNDAKTAHLVVDMKTRIERLREQTQNVE